MENKLFINLGLTEHQWNILLDIVDKEAHSMLESYEDKKRKWKTEDLASKKYRKTLQDMVDTICETLQEANKSYSKTREPREIRE